jgi:hypothetical protein
MRTKPSKKPATSEVHPLLKTILDGGQQSWMKKLGESLKQNGRETGPKVEVAFSLGEFYQSQVFRYAMRLTDLPQQLRVVANFMVHRPRGRTFKKLGIRRGEYVSYHYRNFVVLLQTASDVAIRLTGVTLALGLNMREMKYSTVVENQWTTRWQLKAPLERIQQVTNPHKRTRNEWVHAGEEPLIESTQTVALVESAQHLSGGEEIWLSEPQLEEAFDEACDELAEQISDSAKALHEAVQALLTALQPPFGYWSSRLESDWRTQ